MNRHGPLVSKQPNRRLVSRRELERMTPLPPDTPSVAPTLIVGPGRVGRAFERSLSAAGGASRLAGRDDLGEAAATAEVALLCVPDVEISAACEAVVAAAPGLRFVGHTSGATRLDALAADMRTAGSARSRFTRCRRSRRAR